MVASVSRSTKAALCVGLLVGTSDDGRVIVGGNDPLRRAQHIDGYDLQLGSDVFGRDPAAGRGREVPRRLERYAFTHHDKISCLEDCRPDA
jgi:hypothetical protein